MTWSPLITDGQRDELASVIREIVDALTANGARHPGDHADRALLRTYLLQDGVVDDPDGDAAVALSAAVNGLADAGPALLGGATGIGWTVSHLAEGDVADQVCAAIDGALARRLPDDYDLVRGVVGTGVYALERRHEALMTAVLDRLEATAIPRLGGLAWHTPPALLPPWHLDAAPDGYWNLGLAHGIPGVIGLLARFVANGIAPARSRALLDGAVTHFLAVEPPSPTGRYPSWRIGAADAPDSTRDQVPNGRLAWCYGDLGAAMALTAAVQLDPRWMDDAMTLAHDCAARRRTANDAGLCHGAFGNAHMFNRLRCATGDPAFAEAARYWLAQGLALRSELPIAGFPALEDGDQWKADPSLLTGAVGVALVLHAAISELSPDWDRMLLLDLD